MGLAEETDFDFNLTDTDVQIDLTSCLKQKECRFFKEMILAEYFTKNNISEISFCNEENGYKSCRKCEVEE